MLLSAARLATVGVPRVRILGIDPGTVRLGYGVIDRWGPGRIAYVECGVIAPSPRLDRFQRLACIGRELRDVVAELRPDVIAMEDAFFGKNVQSTLALGEARGVALFVAADAELSVSGYAPARVKQTIVGHGAATKDQINFLVRALLSLRRPPAADAADALAIAICHARLSSANAKLTAFHVGTDRHRRSRLDGADPKPDGTRRKRAVDPSAEATDAKRPPEHKLDAPDRARAGKNDADAYPAAAAADRKAARP